MPGKRSALEFTVKGRHQGNCAAKMSQANLAVALSDGHPATLFQRRNQLGTGNDR
jgi:hypothetical protein